MHSAFLILLFFLFPTSFSSLCHRLNSTDHSYWLTSEDIKKENETCNEDFAYDKNNAIPCVTTTRNGVLWTGCFNKTEHGDDVRSICEEAFKLYPRRSHCDYSDHSLYREYEIKGGNSTCCCFKDNCNANFLPNLMLRMRDSEEILTPKWRKVLRRFLAIITLLTVFCVLTVIEAHIEGYIRYTLLPKLRTLSSKRFSKVEATAVQGPFLPGELPMSNPSTPSTNATQRSTIRNNRTTKTDKTESTLITTTPVVSTQKSSHTKRMQSNRKTRTLATPQTKTPHHGSPLLLQHTPTSKSKTAKKLKQLVQDNTQRTQE